MHHEPTRRTVARVLPVSSEGKVLLLLGCDPALPEVRYWFTVGGAADAGESLAEAATRAGQAAHGGRGLGQWDDASAPGAGRGVAEQVEQVVVDLGRRALVGERVLPRAVWGCCR